MADSSSWVIYFLCGMMDGVCERATLAAVQVRPQSSSVVPMKMTVSVNGKVNVC